MRKQRKRLYAALLCSSIVLSLVSTPVSAAETGQLTNPPTSTEGPDSPESTSGNEAAAMLNGLYTTLSITNGEAEVTTASELTGALADSSISRITLKGDIDIGSTLTVNRTVTLDLNGCVLKMTGSDSVIKVAADGDLTIQDRNTTTQHKFNPHCKYLTWYIDMWKLDNGGSEIVSGGVITGGGGDQSDGGGVLVAGGTLVMAGGNIVGCSAMSRGGGVYLGKDSDTGKSGTFIMTSGSIIGCAAQLGGGVYVATGCTFAMATSSNIHNCIANNDGGGVINHGTFRMYGGTISACTTVALGGGGVCNKGTFIMSDGMIKGCTSPDGQYASGGGVRNSNQFTMTGGTIGDPDNPNDASSVYNTSSQETTLTISNNAKIHTNVTNVGILNADGGEIAGTMMNDTNRYGTGTITGSEGASGSTKFQDKVTNNGIIRKGTFTNEVINESSGTINGGTFTGTVENRGGTISGGDFSGTTLPVKLMITFEPNNGEPVITQEVNWSKDGAALTAPDPVPTKEGHSLDGWYYDNNGTETKWNFDTDTVKCTMTLKAKWTKNTTPIIPGNNTNNIVEQYKTDDSNSGEQTDREVPSLVVKNTTSYMTYTVQAGDTLWAIARKYNCSITEIVAANSDRIKNPNRIHAGWQLKIPKSGAPVSGSTPNAVLPENKKSGIYIVRQGDTLWKIARKYNCSVAEIVSLNRELIRNPALIYSGWELKVPQN